MCIIYVYVYNICSCVYTWYMFACACLCPDAKSVKDDDEDVVRILEGKLESDLMTHDDTFANMQTLDAVREQWELKYPME